MPGLIEGHSHVLLHPYNETSGTTRCCKESLGLRTARAVNHLRATLQAGFTTIRDLGTEGAGYADAELKQAVEQGIIPGPRMLVTTRAIVATGSYGPRGLPWNGACRRAPKRRTATRSSASCAIRSATAPTGSRSTPTIAGARAARPRPTFSLDELTLIVETARSSGRPVVAHASTAEGHAARDSGRRRDDRARRRRHAGDLQADGRAQRRACARRSRPAMRRRSTPAGRRATRRNRPSITRKRASFKTALDAGVTILSGSDVGVFTHGDNAREIELMVDYGMPPIDALKSATSIGARVLHMETGSARVKAGTARRP